MKYPKAGDLQRATSMQITSNPCNCAHANPCVHRNPWEVRSDSGLEGVFADEDEARFYAEEIRGSGARGVVIESRKRLHPRLQRNPAALGWEHASRTIANMAQNIESIGVDGCNSLLKYVAVEVQGVSYGWLLRCEPNGRDVTVELVDGAVEKFDAQQVWPLAGHVPESPTLLRMRAKWKAEDEEESRGRGNPSSRLFSGVYPTGIVYADKAREVDGDYLRVAFLPFSTLQLEWEPGKHPPELVKEITADAARIAARRGEDFQVSTAGQTVRLGNPGPRVLREKYGDSSEIVIESNRYGYTGWLENKRGGGRLPISFGPKRPETLREAMELAKKFLRGVYGKSNPASNPARRRDTEVPIFGMGSSFVGVDPNGEAYVIDDATGVSFMGPTADAWADRLGVEHRSISPRVNPAGLTAKGERMYEHIKAGYGDDPRATEIASRTVLARAHDVPGLKRNADARWRVWIADAPDSYVCVTAGGYMDAMRKAAMQFRGAQNNEVVEMIAKIDGGRAIESLVTIHHSGRLTFHPAPSRGTP